MTVRRTGAVRAPSVVVALTLPAVLLLPGSAYPGGGPISGTGDSVCAAGMAGPRGLLFTPAGVLLAVEQSAGTIVRITPDGKVDRLARGFSAPHDLAADASGNLYVAETGSGRILRMTGDF